MKKLFKAVALTLVLCVLLSNASLAAAPESLVFGDADGDGRVTYADARLTFWAALGVKAIEEGREPLCDVNLNGRLDFSDAASIVAKLVFNLNRFGFETKAYPEGEKIETPEGRTLFESFMHSIDVNDFRMNFTIIEFSKLTDANRGIDRGTMELDVKDYCMSINIKLLTKGLQLIIYESNTYIVAPTLRMYSKANGLDIGVENFPVFQMPDVSGRLLNVSRLTVCGVDYICEEYSTESLGTIRHFFVNGVLTRTEVRDENGKIESILLLSDLGKADVSTFTIPESYIEVEPNRLIGLLGI